jgi:hypothetical protein
MTYLSPGLRFFHQGQFQGRKKRISPHLGRAPEEPVDLKLEEFYGRMLSILREPLVRQGEWQLLKCESAWDGNWTWDGFLAFAWESPDGDRLLVVVNFAPNQSQCYVRLPFADLAGKHWTLQDLLGEVIYHRNGDELQSRGLYLDVAPWQRHVFSFERS